MSAFARAFLIGRVGIDPELTTTNEAQRARVRIRVAVTRLQFDQQTQTYQETATDWFTVIFWGQMAERVTQSIKKGDLIFVEGDLRVRQWQDQQGNNREIVEIHALTYRKLASPHTKPTQQTETEKISPEEIPPPDLSSFDITEDLLDTDSEPKSDQKPTEDDLPF